VRGGWRSDTLSRIHLVDETAGKSEQPAVAFSTDSNRAETPRTGPIRPDFIPT
jgi:hypothetical protein